MPPPFTACTPLRAANDSGPRKAVAIKWVVVHSTEGGTAESVARYFHSQDVGDDDGASTQIVVDDGGCYRCVPDLVIPWGAHGVNRGGLHVEHCGFAHWTRREWLSHDGTLEVSAQHAARWAWQYRIPLRWIGPRGLKIGLRGFTTHHDASRAFTPGGHTDPGPGFPKDLYLQRVRDLVDEMD